MPGKLIVIEGLDGSGKSTQVGLLKRRLEGAGVPLRRIKLPDYADPSSVLVRMYLDGEFGRDPSDVNAYAASAFYAVDRYASYHRHWKADYLRGLLILADRYTSSNAIHQAVKLPREQWPAFIDWLCDFEYEKLGLPRPDRVLWLDMPVEAAQGLLLKRYGGDGMKRDVHEANAAYLLRCREAAAFAAQKLNWDVIACSDGKAPLPVEDIGGRVFAALREELGL